ncbi:uncharacterized protein LOC132712979 [Ruditapes philippinarum]|uniref:uncharacterized protein LOC132712979 n=1 Tax=Ruditapes philippinarum TaxID=129788 RepID=UPI00295A81D7|nr:uncharacterized protein LOC132712979 [Ruditapes philippinarum]
MAAVQKPVLSEMKFHNWIKNGVVLVLTKEGLQDIVANEITNFHDELYRDKTTKTKITTPCKTCLTENVVKCSSKNKICRFYQRKCVNVHKTCPFGVCQNVRDGIEDAHRFNRPSWKNTDARQWSDAPWQIAKCFMSTDGYESSLSAAETDFNGIINVIINCKRFDSKVQTDLSNNNNIFCKARAIGNKHRHHHGYELSSKEFQDNISILIKVLEDFVQSNQKAESAIKSIRELSSDSWTITDTSRDITKYLQDAIDEAKESIDKSKQNLLDAAKQSIKSNAQEGISEVLGELRQLFSKHKSEIEHAVRRGIKRIRRESETALEEMQKKQKQDNAVYTKQKDEIRNRLIQTYKHQCSNLPVSSLLEEENLPLLTFYVKPYMRQLEHHKIQKEEVPVETYNNIFHKHGKKCRSIYVTGDAGIGKTAFCQRLALLWSIAQVHPKLDVEDESVKEDAEIIGDFDFLFYISLRDTSFCHIEDIIQHQLMGTLDRKEVLLEILNTEKCIVVLDGLDEWTHPLKRKHCPGNIKIPHRPAVEKCVYLTTSRPYKLERLRLSSQEIDQQIEILPMEEGVGFTFVELLIDCLNEKCGLQKDPEEFIKNVAENKLEDLLDVPLLTTHLVCLWFDGELTQMSLSEVYANTLEMMFQRSLQKETRNEAIQYPSINEKPDTRVPKCLSKLTNVGKHVSLLYRLGRLAFEALFIETESSLIFKGSDLERYELTEDVVSYLCSVGVLSKNKAIGFLTKRKHTLSFPHKLYQEFMGALYISMSVNKEDEIRKTIVKACKTLQDLKKFSNVFVFLASLAPSAIETLFHTMNVFLSKEVSNYREFSCSVMFNFISQRRKQVEYDVQTVQDLAEKCFEECKRSGGESINMNLEDVFIYKRNAPIIWKLLRSNKRTIKSMFAAGITEIEITPVLSELVRLEVRFINSGSEFQHYNQLIELSKGTLKNLSVSYCHQISDIPFHTCENLTSLYFHDVKIRHGHLVELIRFVSEKHDMSQIGLDCVECEDDGDKCILGNLDLRNHTKIFLLGIGGINIKNVLVNVEELYRLRLNNTEKGEPAPWSKPLLDDLTCAPVLKKFFVSNITDDDTIGALVRMIYSLQKLKYLYILKMNFGDHILSVDPEGEDVEIEMSHVTLSNESFRCFIRSIANALKEITVNLLFYEIPGTTREDIVKYIKSIRTLHVIRNTEYNMKFIKRSNSIQDQSNP